MSNTPKLGLPYIITSQAQKEITHNESLEIIDALLQMLIVDIVNASPPTPLDGDVFIVGSNPTGAFLGHSNDLAQYINSSWIFYQPSEGWNGYILSKKSYYKFDGSSWQLSSASSIVGLEGVPSFVGHAKKLLVVNLTEDGITYQTLSGNMLGSEGCSILSSLDDNSKFNFKKLKSVNNKISITEDVNTISFNGEHTHDEYYEKDAVNELLNDKIDKLSTNFIEGHIPAFNLQGDIVDSGYSPSDLGAGGGSGEANNGMNIGNGVGIFKEKVGTTLNFKTLKSSSDIVFTSNSDNIEISRNNFSYGGLARNILASGKINKYGQQEYFKIVPNIIQSDIIPTMTSDILPNGICESTTPTIGDAWNVFDDNINTYILFSSGQIPADIIYTFETNVVIGAYTIYYPIGLNISKSPTSWVVYGSVDKINWDIIDEQVGQVFTNDEKKIFNINLNGIFYYKYIKFGFKENAELAIGELELFTYDTNVITMAGESHDIIINFANGVNSVKGIDDYIYIVSTDIIIDNIFTSNTKNYIYADYNVTSKNISFNSTTIKPIYSFTMPDHPLINMHWFDLSQYKMNVWNGVSWDEKIRIFLFDVDVNSNGHFTTFNPVKLYTLPFIRAEYIDGAIGVATNVGNGKGLFKSVNYTDKCLEFKSIIGGVGILLSEDDNEVKIQVSENNWIDVNDNYAITNSSKVFVDTSLKSLNIILKSSPLNGDTCEFMDKKGTFDVYNLTLNGNGYNICGQSSLVLSKKDTCIEFVFVDNTIGWKIRRYIYNIQAFEDFVTQTAVAL